MIENGNIYMYVEMFCLVIGNRKTGNTRKQLEEIK